MKIIILVIISSTACFFISCGGGGQTTYDESGPLKIAQEAGKFLYGCPDFFFPPNVYGSDPYQQNQTSAVAWCPSILVSNPLSVETKNRYIQRLNSATHSNQQSWYGYLETPGNPPTGYPGYYYYSGPNIIFVPELTYQTGFICYGLIYRAIIDAGYNPFNNVPQSVNALTNRLIGPIDPQINPPRVGDIVAYDFDDDGVYEHAGIIVNNTASNEKDWQVVSSIGIIEIFKYGAQKRRLGVFGSTNGGEFTVWNPQWENWKKYYFYVNTN